MVNGTLEYTMSTDQAAERREHLLVRPAHQCRARGCHVVYVPLGYPHHQVVECVAESPVEFQVLGKYRRPSVHVGALACVTCPECQ